MRVEYTAFQNDVGKPSRGVREAQAHMTKLAYMFEDKGLEAHLEKTCYILMKGNKKDVNKTEAELKMNPIVFGSFVMDRKKEDKYLGQVLHEDGLADSVDATVASRASKFKGALFEVRSVIEEFSMQTMGGMMAAKTLLERALLPSLLSGCCNWNGIRKKTEDDIGDLIMMYRRVMLKVPEGTPKIGIISESSSLRYKWRIWEAKDPESGDVLPGQENI